MFPPASRHLLRTAAALWLAALAACADAPPRPAGGDPADLASRTVTRTDDAGRLVALPRPARRIVSLIPSATETVVAMGLADLLVARTDFDAGPGVDSLPSVGGGVDPSLEALVSHRPDLVLTWATGKEAELRERLETLGIPVFAVDVTDTADIFRTVANVGALAGRTDAADSLAASMRAEIEAVRASVASRPTPSVFFIVWHDPPMTTGGGTFIHEMIGVAGGRNVFGDATEPWPNVALEEVVRRRPDVIVLPVGEKGAARLEELRREPGWRDVPAVREGRVVIVDAELMNRPGPRLGEAARRLAQALHPGSAARK